MVPKIVISGDTVFLFGGSMTTIPHHYKYYNDLYKLDMATMVWRKVHDNLPSGMGPEPDKGGGSSSTLTHISSSSAIFFGSILTRSHGEPAFEDDCWHLNLVNAKKIVDPAQIWTRFRSHLVRSDAASVVEPVSKKLWLIGGQKDPSFLHGYTTDVLEMSFNIASLKSILLDHVARNISSDDGSLMPSKFPLGLKSEIETCRERFSICGAEKGCHVCKNSTKK